MDDTTRKMFANTHNIELLLQQMNVARHENVEMQEQRRRLASDASRIRIMIRSKAYTSKPGCDIRLAFPPDEASEVREMFGNKVACQVMQNGTIIVMKGDTLMISDNKGTGQISLSSYGDTIINAYGTEYGVVYLKKTVVDGMMVFSRDETIAINDQSI